MTNPTNAYTVPSVSITTARTGASSKANELGMRAMQERAYAKRGEQYLLIKSPPASGKSRALMFIALDKLHFAITGQTAAEIIADRATADHPSMGLTTWRKAPKGKILKTDIGIAKNYLRPDELKSLNHIVDMYLDHAEFQASRGRLMKMGEWGEKLDAFLQFNEQEILQDKGKVSHAVALALAEKEYEVFRVDQDRRYESDFDRIVNNLPKPKQPPKG